MINVTKTYLPAPEKYKKYIDIIYKNGWITNYGPLVQELEKKLASYLGVKNVVLVANGTVALEIAYRTLGLKGYAITSPFSFVATTSSLVTNGLKPIFVDIDPHSLNIDVRNIEQYITPNTNAIVATHVFGNACAVEKIASIARKHDLKVVYDAAHAFNVKYKEQSILHYGDISILSFHATKIFHTIEGGALIINDDSLVEKARYLINFGIENAESIPELGTNAKMNEFEAAMGLCMLDEVDSLISRRKLIYEKYHEELSGLVGFQELSQFETYNYSYFPIVLDNGAQRLKIQQKLSERDIIPRRYFYPSLDTLPYIEPKQYCPVSREICDRILALPLYPDLELSKQKIIIEVIQQTIDKSEN